jgi:hypothetical protein
VKLFTKVNYSNTNGAPTELLVSQSGEVILPQGDRRNERAGAPLTADVDKAELRPGRESWTQPNRSLISQYCVRECPRERPAPRNVPMAQVRFPPLHPASHRARTGDSRSKIVR